MSEALPTGTVTLLFSDMEGSTILLGRLGDDYAAVLDGQRGMLRAAWKRHGGHELGTEGDSFYVAFERPDDAVSAAVQGQQELSGATWPGDEPVLVRMGIHTGVPSRHGDAYVGMDVHRAARVAAAAHGGQILVSDSTARLITGLPDIGTIDLGEHTLKDIPRPERLHQVTASGLRLHFPRIRTIGSATTLPTFVTPLVGRDGETAELTQMLTSSNARLVTLTGPGGTGKTRLAVQVAQAVSGDHHEVHFIGLEAATGTHTMWSTIADSLGVPAEARIPPGLFDHLAHARALLVLDNLEQIQDAADVIDELLRVGPAITVLATSRTPLHVQGEREHEVPSLELPRDDTLTAAQESGAVQLFVRQAVLVRRGFTLTPDNHPDVTEICRRLDGLPLALELAASRIKLLSPQALLKRLDSALDLRTGDGRRPERQQTLRQAIRWSYELLPDDARRVLRLLAAFPGGASIDAMDQIIHLLGLPLDGFDSLEQLVNASLVRVTETPDGEPRFRLLNTILAFARDEADAHGETADVLRAALQLAFDVVEDPGRWTANGPQRQQHLTWLETEFENLRHTIELGFDFAGTAADDRVGHMVVRIASAVGEHAIARGMMLGEAREWSERADALTRGRPSVAAAWALMTLASHRDLTGDSPEAMRLLQQVEAILDTLADEDLDPDLLDHLRNHALHWSAQVHLSLGEIDASRETYLSLVSSSWLARSPHMRIRVKLQLALLHALHGEPDKSVMLEREAADDARRYGFEVLESTARHNMACSLRELGDAEQAEELMRAGIPVVFAARSVSDAMYLIEDYALVLIDLQRFEDAALLLGSAAALRERLKIAVKPHETAERQEPHARAQEALSERWTALHAEGGRLPLEEAFRRATAPA